MPDDQLPIGVRVKVLPPRDDSSQIIAERAIRITGSIGRVVEPQVRGRISVQLREGGVFHLEPERVAVLLKKAGSAHGV